MGNGEGKECEGRGILRIHWLRYIQKEEYVQEEKEIWEVIGSKTKNEKKKAKKIKKIAKNKKIGHKNHPRDRFLFIVDGFVVIVTVEPLICYSVVSVAV